MSRTDASDELVELRVMRKMIAAALDLPVETSIRDLTARAATYVLLGKAGEAVNDAQISALRGESAW